MEQLEVPGATELEMRPTRAEYSFERKSQDY